MMSPERTPMCRTSYVMSGCDVFTSARMPNSDDLEMLGSLKDSTIARLLVSGKLPLDGRDDTPVNLSIGDGTAETSFSPQNLKVEQHELERVCQELAREMACLTHAHRKLRGGAIMRCRYCPFGASDARTMYSHYRFHEQVLSSQSAASRSHIEWMVAYQQQKWSVETPTDVSAWGDPLPRPETGMQAGYRTQSVSPRNQPSASNCLRSIVQSIRQNSPGRAADAGPTPSPRAAAVASPIDAGSRGSSPLLSPASSPSIRQRENHVIKVEPDITCDARPESCETTTTSVSPAPPESTRRDDAWTVGREDGARPHPHRVICRLMPRVMGNATPMLRAMLGKRRRTASLSSDLSAGPMDGHDSCKSPSTTTKDTASQCDELPVRSPQENAAVQCELIASGCTPLDDETAGRYSGERLSGGRLRCLHCGIAFDDEVLHSLHMGCHSHRDPFICNVCGRQCNDRYGFYTHIMRGHQSP